MTELVDNVWNFLTEVDKWKVIGSASITFLTIVLIRRMVRKRSVMSRIKKKQEQLQEARSRLRDRVRTCPPLSHFKELDALQVQQRLQANEMTPLEALRLYQKRMVDALESNCICEIIEEAEAVAMSVSADVQSPIRGMPVSLKECTEVAGYDSPVGLVSGVLDPAKEDSVLMKVLRKVGAVPFVTTTMSPTGICLDASTEIYGKQRNPLDAKRLAGGSSTGEAILLVKDGSPLGFGTDIAGSIRIPSAFCGICGLKLTSNRISTIGLRSVAEDGFAHIHPVFGPMAKCTSLLADAMKAILCSAMFELDPRVPELPFNDRIYSGTEPLVIGYCACIGEELAVRPVVAVEAAMHKVISLLRSKGHKLVKFNIPDPDKLISMSSTAMFANGGASLRKAVQDDPANSRLRLLCFILSIPVFIRRSVAWLIHRFISRPIGAAIRSSTGCQSTQDVLFLLNEISGYQVEFAKAWSEAKLDVLICPGMPFPAPLDTTPDLLISGLTNYVLPYNVLDYPAGVLPVAKVSAADVKASKDAEEEYRRKGDWLNAKISSQQEGTQGLPIGLQVVGKPLCEEVVLRVMREIERGVSEA